MRGVVTVTGVVAPGEVGICSLGEHLVARLPVARPVLASDTWFYEQKVRMDLLGDLMLGRANRDDATLDADDAETELARFAEAGGDLVLDVTRPGQDRRPNALRALSVRSGVRVVMTAWATADSAALADELIEGVDGVRAGVIGLDGREIASDAADAAFAVAAETGAPILVATGGDAGIARAAARRAEALGPGRVALGGVGALAADGALLSDLAATGIGLAFDRLGRIPTIRTRVSDHEIAQAIAGLIAAGQGGRVLLGCGLDRKHALTVYGGNGLRFVPRQFLPYLGFAGVGPEDARRLVTANPAAFLTWMGDVA